MPFWTSPLNSFWQEVLSEFDNSASFIILTNKVTVMEFQKPGGLYISMAFLLRYSPILLYLNSICKGKLDFGRLRSSRTDLKNHFQFFSQEKPFYVSQIQYLSIFDQWYQGGSKIGLSQKMKAQNKEALWALVSRSGILVGNSTLSYWFSVSKNQWTPSSFFLDLSPDDQIDHHAILQRNPNLIRSSQ